MARFNFNNYNFQSLFRTIQPMKGRKESNEVMYIQHSIRCLTNIVYFYVFLLFIFLLWGSHLAILRDYC